MTLYPRFMLLTLVTVPKNEGKDIICGGSTHKRTLSTSHDKKRKLKSNVGSHDPTNVGVITQHTWKLVK